jgi:hypothetical protein
MKWIHRVLGRDVGGKQNVLVLNDEAQHAYRIRQSESDLLEEREALDERRSRISPRKRRCGSTAV